MKYLQFCFAVFAMIGAIADRVTLEIENSKDVCKRITKTNQTLIDQAQNGQFSDDELREYYNCFGFSIYYIKYKSVGYYGNQKREVLSLDRDALRDWMVNKLQYDSETTDHALSSCGLDAPQPDLFDPIKCLSENKLPVDVVSANFVDHSVEDLNKLQDFCIDRLNVDQDTIAEAQKGNMNTSDIGLTVYYACFSTHAGFFDWGEFHFIHFKNWLKVFLKYDSDKVDLALQKCYKAKVADGYDEEMVENFLKVIKCFADEQVPVDVMANQ